MNTENTEKKWTSKEMILRLQQIAVRPLEIDEHGYPTADDSTLFKCEVTGRLVTLDDLTVDHIVPREKGGTDEMSNIQLVCAEFNSVKGTSTMDNIIQLSKEILEHAGFKVIKPIKRSAA